MVEDNTIIGFLDLVADHGIVTTSQTGRELQVHGRVVHLVDLDNLHLFQLAQTLLYLDGLGRLITEALHKVTYVGHLFLLILIGTHLLFAALFSKHHILVVLHAIVNDATTGNLKGAVGHIINKSAVVTHQHHCPTPRGQQLLEPLDRLDVEVVGGLVEQQHVGTAQQNLGQLDTHAPAARELGGGPVEVTPLESQAHQRTFYLGLIALGTQHLIAFVLGREFLNQSHIVVALIVGTLVQLLLHALNAVGHLLDVSKGFLGLLAHGGVVLKYHHLGQITHRGIRTRAHRARRWLLFATEHLEERRFAGTVLTHQGHTVLIVNHEGGVAKQGLHPEFHLQTFYRYHTRFLFIY